MKEQQTVSVALPKGLADKIEARLAGTSPMSVSDYVIRAVELCLSGEGPKAGKPDALPTDDEQTVRERLKSLGYLD